MAIIPRQQVETILKNAPPGSNKQQILDGLINRGYELEGVDTNLAKADIARRTAAIQPAPEKTFKDRVVEFGKDAIGDFKQIGKETMATVQKSADIISNASDQITPPADNTIDLSKGMTPKKDRSVGHLFQAVGALANAGADTIGAAFKGALKIVLPQEAEDKLKELAAKGINNAMQDPLISTVTEKAKEIYANLSPEQQKNVDALGGIANLVTQFVGAGTAESGAKTVVNTARKFGMRAVESVAEDTARIANATDTVMSKGRSLIKGFNDPEVLTEAKVSLNPMKALEGTGQDIVVSVKSPVNGQKPMLKKLSELTPEERTMVQVDTQQNFDNFLQQAKKFKNDRSVDGGSPVEIVGKRVDDALAVADKERQTIGSQMGEIEQKYLTNQVPLGDGIIGDLKTLSDKFKKQRFSMDTGGAPVAQKLGEDIDLLVQNPTVEDRLQFVRDWQDYTRNAKDNFGNFKENAAVNSAVEKIVNRVRNETVDYISNTDEAYKNLRIEYAKHIQLQDIGDALLGKDGAMGERIKGAATVKRAIQSNSDAGARQFLARLKEVTGYDAIKEGDIALTAMENAGDYQGLSLLNVLNEGKGGVVKKVLEKGRDVLVGDNESRVRKYIGTSESKAPTQLKPKQSSKKLSYNLSIPKEAELSIGKIPAEVRANIVEIIDDFRLNKGKNLTLQQDAARIAEDLNLPKSKTYGALVNKLEKILQASE